MPPKKNIKENKVVANISDDEFKKLKKSWLEITNKIVELEEKISLLKTERDNIVIKIIDHNTTSPDNLVQVSNINLKTQDDNNLSSDESESDIESISNSDSDEDITDSDSDDDE